MRNKILIGLLASGVLFGCQQQSKTAANFSSSTLPSQASSEVELDISIWPSLESEVKQQSNVEQQVSDILASMTIEQKVAQMIQPEIRDLTVDDMRKYGFGSYLNGGGSFPNGNKHATPQDWIALAEAFYEASVDDSLDGSSIPTMWGTDAVHGHNNVIGATFFPHNIGLGAANNPELIEAIAQATAIEVMATGIDWVFAPTVATVRDDRWGRTYEGYSEDPDIVRDYSAAIVHGLQGRYGSTFMQDDRVISTVKHFIGDGGTVGGDDQGNNISSEQDLFDIHGQGYVGGLTAGAQTAMASFNSWHGDKLHGNEYLLTQVLKQKMGFDGFVVGDWSGHGQVKNCTNESCPQAINAGLDMFMAPTADWKPLYYNTIEQVKNGTILMSRVDDAVTRILRVKVRAGIFTKPSPANRKFSGRTELIGSDKHRALARDAVRQSLVMLKNNNSVLPLSPNQKIFITGDGADNIGKSAGGWSVTWQGTGNQNSDFPGGTSIYQGFKTQVDEAGGSVELGTNDKFNEKPDVAIVVFGEDPYAEGHGDRESVAYQRDNNADYNTLKSLQSQGIPTVSVFITGRALWINPELNVSDAFVVAWLPGTEGEGIADVLLTDKNDQPQYDVTGRLSYSWPSSSNQTSVNKGDENYNPLFAYGYGLSYDDKVDVAQQVETITLDVDSQYKGRNIYVTKLYEPWRMWLFSEEKQYALTSSTVSAPGIQYRTFDKVVQEDALQLTVNSPSVNSNGPVSFYIQSRGSFREDLSADLRNDAVLTFDYQVSQALEGQAWLALQCDNGYQCDAKLDISNTFKTTTKEWLTYSISLAKLKDAGMQFADATRPFGLEFEGKAQVRIANIKIVVKGE